jgi:hypothetical protein
MDKSTAIQHIMKTRGIRKQTPGAVGKSHAKTERAQIRMLSPEEKKERRLERSRVHAKNSRDKVRSRIAGLEAALAKEKLDHERTQHRLDAIEKREKQLEVTMDLLTNSANPENTIDVSPHYGYCEMDDATMDGLIAEAQNSSDTNLSGGDTDHTFMTDEELNAEEWTDKEWDEWQETLKAWDKETGFDIIKAMEKGLSPEEDAMLRAAIATLMKDPSVNAGSHC